MALRLPTLPIKLDPLIAEAKRRARIRRSLLGLALLLVAGSAIGVTLTRQHNQVRVTASGQTGAPVALGTQHLVTDGFGWGHTHPRSIFNGGDPSGHAWHLTWRHWGAPTAYARGLVTLSRPGGNFYPTPALIEFRASHIGRCTPGGPRAYTRLDARSPVRPGGRLTHWYPWSGWRSICKFSPTLR